MFPAMMLDPKQIMKVASMFLAHLARPIISECPKELRAMCTFIEAFKELVIYRKLIWTGEILSPL
jgi:hypothetical protein